MDQKLQDAQKNERRMKDELNTKDQQIKAL